MQSFRAAASTQDQEACHTRTTMSSEKRGSATHADYDFCGRALALARGRPLPTGVVFTAAGVNFSLVYRHATAVSLSLAYDGRRSDPYGAPDRDLYIALHAAPQPATFKIPRSPSGRPWRRAVDTGLNPLDDVACLDEGPPVSELGDYVLKPCLMIILVSED